MISNKKHFFHLFLKNSNFIRNNKYLTPFLPSNQVPGIFRPIVAPKYTIEQSESFELPNAIASTAEPISSLKLLHTSEGLNSRVKVQKASRSRPTTPSVQIISTTTLSPLSSADDHISFVEIKAPNKKIFKGRPVVKINNGVPLYKVSTAAPHTQNDFSSSKETFSSYYLPQKYER